MIDIEMYVVVSIKGPSSRANQQICYYRIRNHQPIILSNTYVLRRPELSSN